jgi:chitinase
MKGWRGSLAAAVALTVVIVSPGSFDVGVPGSHHGGSMHPAMAAQPSHAPLAPALQRRAARLTDELLALGSAKGTQMHTRNLARRLAALSRARQRTMLGLLRRDPAAARALLLPARLRHTLARVAGVQLERPVALTGSYRVWHHDDFSDESRDTFLDQLVTGDGKVVTLHASNSGVSVPLTFARLRPTRISVRGYAFRDQLLATHVRTLHGARHLAATSATAAATTGTINTAVIVADFANSTASIDMDALKAQFQGDPGHDVVSYFKEASYGKMTLAPSFFGPYRLTENASSGCGTFNESELMNLANADINYTQFKRLVFVINCTGYGAVSTNESTTSTPDGNANLATVIEDAEYSQRLYVPIHELSHTLGGFNFHASDYICKPDAFEDPTRFDQGCDTPEYTDTFDVLGGDGTSIDQLNPYHKWNAGWLSSSQFPTVTSSGTYTLAPYESPGSGVVALNIPRGSSGSEFTVEYRQPIGFDAGIGSCPGCTVTQGASIRLSRFGVTGGGGGSDTELIDTTPGTINDGGSLYTYDAWDGALLPGKSFTDPEYGITITTVSAGSSGLTLSVSLSSQASCAHAAPKIGTVSLTSGAGTTSPTYTLSVTNADSAACAATSFRYLTSSSVGTQYTATPDFVTLAPGASKTVSLVAALPKTATAGTYALSLGQISSNSVGNCAKCYLTAPLPTQSYQFSPPADSTPPGAPTAPSAVALGAGVVKLTWGASTDNVGVVGYTILRNGASVTTTTGTSYVDTGVAGSTAYSYSIQAFDATGNSSTAATVSVTTPAKQDLRAPSRPLVTASATDRTVTLSWSPSLDLGSGVAAYRLAPCLLEQCTVPATTTSLQIGGLATRTRYDLTVSAIDGDGNVGASQTTTVYTAPAGDSAPAQPQRFYTPSGTFGATKLAWTASNGATGYEIFRNGRPVTIVSGTSFTDTSPGSHAYYVEAVDAAGALSPPTPVVSTSGSSAPLADATPPTAALTAPAQGAAVSGSVPLTALASDNVGVYRVWLYVDGACIAMLSKSPYTFTWDTTTVSNGTHWLNEVVSDAAGNFTSDGGYAVTTLNGGGGGGSDTTPPSVSITAPLAGANVSGSVPVAASASDNVGVTKIEFSVDGALVATSTAAPFGFSWSASTATAGAHTITATAYDAAGNKSADSVGLTVAGAVDTTPPSVSIVSPTSGATVSGTVQVQVSASDDIGVTKVTLAVDGATTGTLTASPWTFDVGTLALANGTHSFAATASDAAGNSATAQVTVTVQNAAADTTAPSKPSNVKVAVAGTTQVALFWTPSTDTVGVTAYDVYRDGAQVAETTLPNYLDSGLTPGTTHVYSVRARDAAGNMSAASSNLNAKTVALSTASTGTVAGVVYNGSGRPVANAVVQLTGNGVSKSAKTNTSGVYKFTSLPPGQYSLTLTLPTTAGATSSVAGGFPDVTLVAGQTLVVKAA